MRFSGPLAAVAGIVAVLAVSGPASAHGSDAPDATDYRTTVTAQAGLPGVSVRTVEAGARLELVNTSGSPVEVLGYAGEPYLEIRPDGVYRNVHSPATYVNETLTGDSPVPPTADPTAAPQWDRIATTPAVRWHDQRTHWLGAALPAQATADPTREHRVRDWTVPLRRGAAIHPVRGTLDWVPAPAPGSWWATILLAAVAVTAVTRRRGRAAVAALSVVGGLTALGYALARQLDSGTPARLPLDQPWIALCGVAAVLVGAWTFRRRTDFPVGLAGVGLAVFAGLTNVAVFARAVLPAPGPAWASRTAVAVTTAIGLGLVAGTVLRLRDALRPAAALTLTASLERRGTDPAPAPRSAAGGAEAPPALAP